MTKAMQAMSRTAAALSLLAAMTLTGANVAFGKAVVAVFPIYVFVLFRFVISSAALLAVAGTEQGPKLKDMSLGQWRDLVLMSLLGMVGFTVFMFEGLKRTAAADAGIITATLPAVVALMGVVVGERLSRLQAGAVALAVAGLALVHTGSASAGTSTLVGNLLVGAAVLCEASFVLLGKRLAPPFRPLRLALGANLVGLVLALPLALGELPRFDPITITLQMWALGTWYALAASVICLWLWYRGLPYVETWLAGLATAAIPVSALALSALYLGETIGGLRLAGAGMVIAAIVVGAVAPDHRRVPPPL
jgi:drug/metabolite transporter (DMT)-like permease